MLFLPGQSHVRAAEMENICTVDFLLFGCKWTRKLNFHFLSYISIVYFSLILVSRLCFFPQSVNFSSASQWNCCGWEVKATTCLLWHKAFPFPSDPALSEEFTPLLITTAGLWIQFLRDQIMAARARSESPTPPLSSSAPHRLFLASSHWEEDKEAAARENTWFAWLPVLSWTRNCTWRRCQSDVIL